MPDILQGLLSRKEKIAKLPEASQRAIWGVAFSQSVAPRLREAAAGGGQFEDEQAARERFVTAMLGKPQKPLPSPVETPPSLLDKALATVGAAGAGVAGGFKNIIDKIPAPEGAPLKPFLQDVLGYAESRYPGDVSVAPTAASIAAGIGHQVPAVMAYESGAALVPELAGGVVAGSKAPAAMRALQTLTRTGAGTAALNLTSPESTSGGALLAQTVGFSVVDMLARGFFRSMRAGGPEAASVLNNIRGTLTKSYGGVSNESVAAFSDWTLNVLKRDNPQAYERIVKGEPASTVLNPTEQASLINKASAEKAAADRVAAKNAKTAKVADNQSKQAASGLEALRVKAQAKLDRQAQAFKNKALQREISAYAKATGVVPPEGSEAMKSLQSGAKAAEIVAAEKASVVQRVDNAIATNDAIAMTEEAPALRGMIEDVQSVAEQPKTAAELNAAAKEREKGLLTKAEEHRVATEAERAALPGGQGWIRPQGRLGDMSTQEEYLARRAAGTPPTKSDLVWRQEQFDKLKAATSNPDMFRTHGAGPSEAQVRTSELVDAGLTAEEILEGVKSGKPHQQLMDEAVSKQKAFKSTPKASVKQKIAAASEAKGQRAYTEFGITMTPEAWTTPEDVIAAKRDAQQLLASKIMEQAKTIDEGVRNKTVSLAEAKTMRTQLATKFLTAQKSIEKEEAPKVTRKSRDRLRKRAEAHEMKRAVGEQQAAAEKVGSASTGQEMTEQQAIDEIDTLVKIGFGSTPLQAYAKKVLADVEAAGGTSIDKLEALQEAYAQVKKAMKK